MGGRAELDLRPLSKIGSTNIRPIAAPERVAYHGGPLRVAHVPDTFGQRSGWQYLRPVGGSQGPLRQVSVTVHRCRSAGASTGSIVCRILDWAGFIAST